jgi:hypothetical protein
MPETGSKIYPIPAAMAPAEWLPETKAGNIDVIADHS